MKKLTIALALIFVLSGCGEQTPKTKKSDPPPQNTEQEEPTETLLSSFKTQILDNSENRLNNINLSVNAINGLTLAPGEVFSFNETVGERTEERGYKKAKILLKGEYTLGHGGGVCQVSSTLYNAALLAGLEIIERHAHEKPVSYVEEGKDAAVSYGSLDLKIKNNTDGQLRINLSCDGSELYASFYVLK